MAAEWWRPRAFAQSESGIRIVLPAGRTISNLPHPIFDARHRRVTVYWGGSDVRLQTLTAGLYRYQVQFRQVNHPWQRWTTTTGTWKAITLVRGAHYEFRIHALDRRGNWSPWQTIGITG